MKTSGSSIASAFRVDDDEVVGGGDGAGAESRSVVEQKVGLIAPMKVPVEYANFAFSPNLASELLEYTRINNHAIELINDYPSHPQVLPSFPILLDQKSDGSFRLCI